ncbi:MAG: nucleotidyltransferase family protein, partial [Prolixibacteraceae bacterium]
MNLKDLYYFTGKCLTTDKNPIHKESIDEAFRSGKVPIETFLSLCSNHFVLPAIFVQFRNADLLYVFPQDLAEYLKEIYELNAERNQLITGQVREICKKLQEKNIEPLFLKGTGNLLDNLYADAGERMIGDIDFLVHEKDFFETARLIMDLGYRNERKVYGNLETLKHYPRLFKP